MENKPDYIYSMACFLTGVGLLSYSIIGNLLSNDSISMTVIFFCICSVIPISWLIGYIATKLNISNKMVVIINLGMIVMAILICALNI